MLIKDKKHFSWGALLAVGFAAVFAYMFTPSFGDGLNAFQASDKMFNSISKGSTNYFPGLVEDAAKREGTMVELTVLEDHADLASKAERLLTANGIQAGLDADGLRISGSFGAIIGAALRDSREMFDNEGAVVSGRYQMPEREALYVWWKLFQSMDTALKAEKRFKDAKFLATVVAKGVEVGYNYYGVVPESAGSKAGALIFSLVFYVVYTMWWGYAIFFLFEGFGLVMKAGSKKEV